MRSRFRPPSRPEPAFERSGFILFFGTKAVVKDEPGPRLRTRCPKCEQDTELISKSYRQWFTLFFLPLFPISGKMRFSECANCATTFRIPAEQLKSQVDQADSAQRQRAIGMYNSLRASPANSITLNELMTLYSGMNEFDQAISVARDFPQALKASEQCMTTLGRVYLATNRPADAVEWFDQAVSRNAASGDAHYFKAMAHLSQTPPDLSTAHAAARAARINDHPNAELLLREIEQKQRDAEA